MTAVRILFRHLPGCILALALACVLVSGAPAAARWKPERVTIILGQSAHGFEGRLVRGLARVWSLKLLAPVVVAARGRGQVMVAADAFARSPRDGTVVMAVDLGSLALEYARSRPGWVWTRTFEHLGVFALDPVYLFTADDRKGVTLDAMLRAARTQAQGIGIGHWRALENLALHDAARRAGLRFRVQPVGSGESLVAAVTDGKLALALGHASDLARHRDDIIGTT
jgi:tripartite-type tricarboxylate transporter receptor subunit TctC